MSISARFEADFSQFKSEVASADSSLKGMTSTTGVTTNAIGSLHQGLSSVDRILASMGINLGPQVSALKEMASVSGKSASGLGAVATAGLAVSAAFGGWQLGRYVADWLDLDRSISEATASMLGWGDAAGEAAGARMDVLSRATQIAGVAITDFAVAQRIIIEENARVAASFNNSETRVKSWGNEIAAVRSRGDLPALRADLESKNSTLKELSDQYGISVRALEFYTRTIQDNAAAQKKWADEARVTYAKIAEAQAELNNAGEGWRKTLAAIEPETAKAVAGYLALGASQSALATVYQLTDLQVQAVAKSLKEQQDWLFKADAALVDHTKDIGEAIIRNGGFAAAESQKQLQQYRDMIALAAQLDAQFNAKPSPSARETLAEQTAGIEAMRGIWSDAYIAEKLNQLYESFYRREGAAGNMPGTSYAPPPVWDPSKYHSGSGAAPAVNNFNITQPLGTPEAIGQAVSEALAYVGNAGGVRH